MSSKLSENLRSLMRETKTSENELSRKTGVAQPIIHRLLKGSNKNPKVATLTPIAKYFQITISQLLGDESLVLANVITSIKHKGWTQIPLITWEDAVGWHQLAQNSPNYPQTLTDCSVSKNAFALKVEDHSMETKFSKGTILIVEPNRTPQDRDYVIIHLDNHTTALFRQVLINGTNHYLKPLNPELSGMPLTTLTENDKYLGVVVQARTNCEIL